MSSIFTGGDERGDRDTSIVVRRSTRDKLASFGKKDDTFEIIIKRLIDEHEKLIKLRGYEIE